MRPVLVDVYAIHALAINVAAEVRPLVYDKALLAPPLSEICERGAEQAGAYNEIIVLI